MGLGVRVWFRHQGLRDSTLALGIKGCGVEVGADKVYGKKALPWAGDLIEDLRTCKGLLGEEHQFP